MDILIMAMIIAGAVLMIVNIYRYIGFLRSSRDVLADYVRHDFNLMADRLGQVSRKIVLCSCDYDCDEALDVHPAVTLLCIFYIQT